MSVPGTSAPQDADSARERSWAVFFKEAGDLCHFPDDNGTLHVGLRRPQTWPSQRRKN
ncbi:Hypothetical protein FKW44_020335 [Caligus rogercresseyi]|uniref:Uncharacterized protein n=1 Tax=Caligus rogercresseyi TaxID=217165 RepID=A0A7T8GXU3_CALRO|nr:Hypothetical protein FKW44_020335 [Caligus rogercresseyi]